MIGMELFSLTSVDDDEIDGQTTYETFSRCWNFAQNSIEKKNIKSFNILSVFLPKYFYQHFIKSKQLNRV